MLHLLSVGAIACMMLAVMTRASLGHTGRALTASKLTVASYAVLILCSPLAWLLLAIAGLPGAALGLLGAPTLLRLIQRVRLTRGGEALNAVLVDTARAGSLSALLAAAGISATALL